MTIQHFYSQTVADGTATSVVRPSDWNSVHNQVLNISGNTAGTSQISGSDIIWAGGNNVTLSANGSTVTIVGATIPAQTVQTQASGNIAGIGYTSTTQAGTTVGATHNTAGLSMAWPPFITTYAAQTNQTAASGNIAGAGFTSTTTAGTAVVATHNSAGLSMGVPAFLTTAAATNITSGRAGTGTSYAGTGINATIGLDTNGLALSLAEAVATDTWFATGANTIAGTNTSGTFSNDGYIVSGAGILSAGVSGNTLILSVPAGGGGGDGVNIVQAGTVGTTGTTFSSISGTVRLNGGNNITVSQNGSNDIVFSGPNASSLVAGANITLSTAGSTISIIGGAGGGGGGVTVPEYVPSLWISTAGSTLAQNTLYLNSNIVPNNVTCSFLEIPFVVTAGWTTSTPVTNSTTTTGSSSSASAGQTFTFGVWGDGAGAASTNLYTLATTTWTGSTNISWSQSNSNTSTGTQSIGSTVGYTYGYPVIYSSTLTSSATNSTVTTWGVSTSSFTNSSTFSTNGTSTSGWPGGTNNATWAGSRIVVVPFSTSLPADEAWFGIVRSSATTGAAVAGTHSIVVTSGTTYDSNSRWAPMGYATAQISTMWHPGGMVNGMFTTSYAMSSNYAGAFGSAGAVPKTAILGSSTTNTSGTLSAFYFKLAKEIF